MGFRNPFRFTVDQKTGDVHASDYGPDRGLPTTDRGPEGLVEYNVIKKAGNYGWPFCHGDNQPYAPYDPDTGEVGEKFDCDNLVNESPNNTGLKELPPVQLPEIWYGYGDSETFPEVGSGGSAPMSGPVYQYDADNPSPTKFPAYYDGAAFFYEWSRDYVKELRFDDEGSLLKINDFLSTSEFSKPMDMTFGPDGSLYLLEWGSEFGGGNNDSGLYRIDYAQGQRNPVAKAAASVTDGPVPLEVDFTSEGSEDPDGDSLAYAWDFDATAPGTPPSRRHPHLHREGRLHRPAEGHRLQRQVRLRQHPRHRRQHGAEGHRRDAGGRHAHRVRRQDPVQDHRHRSRGRGDRLRPGRPQPGPRPRRPRTPHHRPARLRGHRRHR